MCVCVCVRAQLHERQYVFVIACARRIYSTERVGKKERMREKEREGGRKR